MYYTDDKIIRNNKNELKTKKNNRFAVQQIYNFRVYIVIENGHYYNNYVKFKFNDISFCEKND